VRGDFALLPLAEESLADDLLHGGAGGIAEVFQFVPARLSTTALIGAGFLGLRDCVGRGNLQPMILTVNIPDDLAEELGAGFQNVGRAALEALAAEAYSKEVLSLEQVRKLLELESRWEAQSVLSRHNVWPGQSADEILADARSSFEFRKTAL
jgi:hypothetical protein